MQKRWVVASTSKRVHDAARTVLGGFTPSRNVSIPRFIASVGFRKLEDFIRNLLKVILGQDFYASAAGEIVSGPPSELIVETFFHATE
jgi:hypothetical protein